MKRLLNVRRNCLLIMFVIPLILMGGLLRGESLTISHIGESLRGSYSDITVDGHYIYCTAGTAGVDIFDGQVPDHPVKIATINLKTDAAAIKIVGKYAYILGGSSGLYIYDVSNPAVPVQVGVFCAYLPTCFDVQGNYAYLGTYNYGLVVADISNPASPVQVGGYHITDHPQKVVVSGNYVYMVASNYQIGDSAVSSTKGTETTNLRIMNVSNPRSPNQIWQYDSPAWIYNIEVNGNNAYLAAGSFGGIRILDITNPTAPNFLGSYTTDHITYDVSVSGSYAYALTKEEGMHVFDISAPQTPVKKGTCAWAAMGQKIVAKDNYVYVADGINGLKIINVSQPTAPVLAGNYQSSGSANAKNVIKSGKYAYILEQSYNAAIFSGLVIYDVSVPSAPVKVGQYQTSTSVYGLFLSDNKIYTIDNMSLKILDVSSPSHPTLLGSLLLAESGYLQAVSGHYAYVTSNNQDLVIIDVSNAAAPVLAGNWTTEGYIGALDVTGNYAYATVEKNGSGYRYLCVINVSNPAAPVTLSDTYMDFPYEPIKINGHYLFATSPSKNRIDVFDISSPAVPVLAGTIEKSWMLANVAIYDSYVFLSERNNGISIIDISQLSQPQIVGRYYPRDAAEGIIAQDGLIYLANGGLEILSYQKASAQPRIQVDHTALNFTMELNTSTVAQQSFTISNSGGGNLPWRITLDPAYSWLSCTPSYGSNGAKIYVSIVPSYIDAAGTYTGTITIASPLAANSPQTINVTLTVTPGSSLNRPFGTFETPIDGNTVSGSIPVTGWALDDLGVQKVQILAEYGNSLTYIGDALFVEGARPDVQELYATYPNSSKAGWGYMLLTHFLPHGDGLYRLHAVATDLEGNQFTLGIHSIIVDNAHAVRPFGAIDTPTQGGNVAGKNYINYGWALTPAPNTIPTNGSTIQVWIDGVAKGKPVYNQYREDIATLFPNYNNSNGAVGYFSFDSTGYSNGTHTIQWTVTDNAGNTDGIGSRYFTIQNNTRSISASDSPQIQEQTTFKSRSHEPANLDPVIVTTGYSKKSYDPVLPDQSGNIALTISELERVEVHFQANDILPVSPLPIGATLDSEQGIFYWQPGVGFLGTYTLDFLINETSGNTTQKTLLITITPKN